MSKKSDNTLSTEQKIEKATQLAGWKVQAVKPGAQSLEYLGLLVPRTDGADLSALPDGRQEYRLSRPQRHSIQIGAFAERPSRLEAIRASGLSDEAIVDYLMDSLTGSDRGRYMLNLWYTCRKKVPAAHRTLSVEAVMFSPDEAFMLASAPLKEKLDAFLITKDDPSQLEKPLRAGRKEAACAAC